MLRRRMLTLTRRDLQVVLLSGLRESPCVQVLELPGGSFKGTSKAFTVRFAVSGCRIPLSLSS